MTPKHATHAARINHVGRQVEPLTEAVKQLSVKIARLDNAVDAARPSHLEAEFGTSVVQAWNDFLELWFNMDLAFAELRLAEQASHKRAERGTKTEQAKANRRRAWAEAPDTPDDNFK